MSIPEKSYQSGETVRVTVTINNKGKTVVKSLKMSVNTIGKKRKTLANPRYVEETSFPVSGPSYWSKGIDYKFPELESDTYELAAEISVKNHTTVSTSLIFYIK